MVLTTIKSRYFLSVLLMIFIIFLLSQNFSNLEEAIVRAKLLNVEPQHSRSKKLVQVLRRASMLDRSVILTFVDQTWASPGSVLDLFLESFRIGQGTKPFLNHLVIVALDGQAFRYCKSIHPHCFYLTNSQKPMLVPLLKHNLMRQVIELGYHFFFTEADVMWLRNPFSHIQRLKELTIACNFYSNDPSRISNKVDGGFFYMSSNDISLEYLKYLKFKRVLYPNSQNQSLCEVTLNDYISQLIDFHITYLEEDIFSGFCQPRRNMGQIVTMRANCCDSIESKVHDLKLLLDDWRNFTALFRENISLRGSSFTWRAPSKCKG